jgi:hypothetical protein
MKIVIQNKLYHILKKKSNKYFTSNLCKYWKGEKNKKVFLLRNRLSKNGYCLTKKAKIKPHKKPIM